MMKKKSFLSASVWALTIVLFVTTILQPLSTVHASTNVVSESKPPLEEIEGSVDEIEGSVDEMGVPIPPEYYRVNSPWNGAIVFKQTGNKEAKWTQDEYTYYMQPREARQFAGELEYSSGKQISLFLIALFYVQPHGTFLGGAALLDSLRRSELANKIRAQSEYGPVQFKLIYHRYGWGYGPASSWDGKYINLGSSGLTKYKSYQLLRPKQ